MDGIDAQFTGSCIGTPEIHRTAAGMPWARVGVVVDNKVRGAETVVRVSMQRPEVLDLAQHLAAGVRVFCRGRLTQRTWKTEAGRLRGGLGLAARKVEIIRDRVSPRDDSGRRPPVAVSVHKGWNYVAT